MKTSVMIAGALLLLLSCASISDEPAASQIQTPDGVTVYVYEYPGAGPSRALPLLMFHQAGADARGELGPIARDLAGEGRAVFAVDLRSGGDRFGGINQTAAGMVAESGYCSAYADMAAALEFVATRTGRRAVLIGSSYSAALVVKLAAERPDRAAGFVAFSPAGGPPMAGCEAERYLTQLSIPGLGIRTPARLEWVAESNRQWRAAGVPVIEVEAEGHGASLLLPERTTGDTTTARSALRDFLARLEGATSDRALAPPL